MLEAGGGGNNSGHLCRHVVEVLALDTKDREIVRAATSCCLNHARVSGRCSGQRLCRWCADSFLWGGGGSSNRCCWKLRTAEMAACAQRNSKAQRRWLQSEPQDQETRIIPGSEVFVQGDRYTVVLLRQVDASEQMRWSGFGGDVGPRKGYMVFHMHADL
ncbi:uncharacterized protein B0I36DRAFT_159492 [Microdochium trichocladiopsis]|uniref:Uncharacterized protein n=1 Tax=Microdochium trichocladiopsis TaxID=1682393 RepID=A0A9P9BN25_9PEZI|nr:uncharacterized protein B0I36DRAFT_159492 [Microdochium trichocladiopsis]KAH7026516.1 hypothetical protein B0I36DRAFT_159492 [Microdochium trichocladiopsis]